MKKLQLTLAAAAVALAVAPMTSMAQKPRLEITRCECALDVTEPVVPNSYDCNVTFIAPASLGELYAHAHGTRELDNELPDLDHVVCHNQVESGPIGCATADGTTTCSTTIEGLTPATEGCPDVPYVDSVVVKVAADQEVDDHGKAPRALKDNMVCVEMVVLPPE